MDSSYKLYTVQNLVIHFKGHSIDWSVTRRQKLYDWNDHVKNKTPGNGKCSVKIFHLDYITNLMLSSYGKQNYTGKNKR